MNAQILSWQGFKLLLCPEVSASLFLRLQVRGLGGSMVSTSAGPQLPESIL
ncbi:MAG TPA: hypothetical protein VK211_15975 [Kamptonema sp.]|nr:hypothetical protein [Kamptonema sp.]